MRSCRGRCRLYRYPWRTSGSLYGADSGDCSLGGIRWGIEYLPPADHCRDCGGSGGHCRDYRHYPELGCHYRVVWQSLEYHLYRDWNDDREREDLVFQPLVSFAECLERHLQRGTDCRDAPRLHYTGAVDIITLPFRFIWENCKDIVISVWNSIKSTVSSVLSAISDVVSSIMEAIWNVISSIWDAISSKVTAVVNAIKIQ